MAGITVPQPIGGGEKAPFQIKDEVIENFRPLKVRVIGAGFSGIAAAIRIPERLRNIDLAVYEQAGGVGGVWWLNKYPGLACDIPSHSYQFTFAPNPHWSSLYAPGAEIQRYLQDVAERFGAMRFIKTFHRLEKAVWNEKTKKWKITVLKVQSGETFEEDTDVLITARGNLNNVRWPQIPGLDSFKGKIMHSGDWDESHDFKNQRVGVIGNGSSAIQILPSLQKLEGMTLKSFMRSPTWISSTFGDHAMMLLGLDPTKHHFPLEKQREFATDHQGYLKYRKVIEDDGNTIQDSTMRGSEMGKIFQGIYQTDMEKRLASRPDLLSFIIPDFSPGCRRLTPGVGYLEALQAPNVEVITESIAAITPTGVTLSAGKEIPLDVIACATGFKVSEAPPFPVIGRGGKTLEERWKPAPESYLSLAVDGFPNLLMLFGPNSAIGFGSLTVILEAEVDYACKALRKLQREDYATLEPRAERVADFTAFVDAYFARTVYTDKCRSWYRSEGGLGDRICGLWPGSTLHALEALRAPRWEDWVFESREEREGGGGGNLLRWLGNGRSATQAEGDPSWYLNPNEIEVPLEGRPEEAERYKARPWSH